MGRVTGKRAHSQRHRLFVAQGGKCAACGLQMERGAAPNADLAPTLDHVIPVAWGGGDSLNNLLLKHARCNRRRGDRGPTDLDFSWLFALARARQAKRAT